MNQWLMLSVEISSITIFFVLIVVTDIIKQFKLYHLRKAMYSINVVSERLNCIGIYTVVWYCYWVIFWLSQAAQLVNIMELTVPFPV